MLKAAILILAGTEGHSEMARVSNALESAKEFKENGDDVKIIFDGAGTQWLNKLSDPQNLLYPLFDAVRDKVTGACAFCAAAFGAAEGAAAGGVELVDEYEGHPSIRQLVKEGYEIITF